MERVRMHLGLRGNQEPPRGLHVLAANQSDGRLPQLSWRCQMNGDSRPLDLSDYPNEFTKIEPRAHNADGLTKLEFRLIEALEAIKARAPKHYEAECEYWEWD